MAKYYEYTIQAISPIRIADEASSQNGQTDTLRYIPGSTLRGMVISKIADLGLLPVYKDKLFANDGFCFLNAYLTKKDQLLLPSPKGFNEDKQDKTGEKEIVNTFKNKETNRNLKRAALGDYCYLKDDTIRYCSVSTGSDLKIKIGNQGDDEKQSMFRNEYMNAGQFFKGFIRLSEDENLNKLVMSFLAEGQIVYLGNARSAGLGKCRILSAKTTDTVPYYIEGTAAENTYMMLLSDTVMRDENGEYCGLNLNEIKDVLGAESVELVQAATSIRTVRGYNRTMERQLPGVPMYTAGSIFKLNIKGNVSEERKKELCDKGIGVRRNEGFGRILFLKNFEDLTKKIRDEYCYSTEPKKKQEVELTKEDLATLRIAARGYYLRTLNDFMQTYILEHSLPCGKMSSSQLGTFVSILTVHRFEPTEAKKSLDEFFRNASEKEGKLNIQKEVASFDPLHNYVNHIFKNPIADTILGDSTPLKEADKVMGIPVAEIFSVEDEDRYRMKLLIEMAQRRFKEVN